MAKKYLFVDAACLDARIKQLSDIFSPDEMLVMNWTSLAQDYEKVFFYDALPGQKRSEEDALYQIRRDAAEARHLHLQTLDRFRVYQGDARWRSGRGHEQKKVDVMIAVDMLKHTIRRNMDHATLLTSDVDFRPLFDALVDEGMFVSLIYNPRNTSHELLGAADARTPLSAATVFKWLDAASQRRMGINPFGWSSPIPVEGETLGVWVDPAKGPIRLFVRSDDGYPRYHVEWKTGDESNAWVNYSANNKEAAINHAAEDHGIARPS